MISFFAKKPFLGNAYPKLADGLTIWRLSSVIRGEQIAEYLGGKFNPSKRSEVNIYLKPNSLKDIEDTDYVDYNDHENAETINQELSKRPKIKVIANCTYSANYLKTKLPNEIICIPQQHINWEGYVNPKRGLKVAGYIGRPSNTSFAINKKVEEQLKKLGIEYFLCYKWTDRKDACDFYKSIDLLIMAYEGTDRYDTPFTTPTKMINAASFGVPTIAYRKKGYEEFEGYYVPYETPEDLIREVERFKDENYYKEFSDKVREKAGEYHISKIAELYKKL